MLLQQVLLDCVTADGSALILSDLGIFVAQNESLIDAVGMDSATGIFGVQTAIVIDPG